MGLSIRPHLAWLVGTAIAAGSAALVVYGRAQSPIDAALPLLAAAAVAAAWAARESRHAGAIACAAPLMIAASIAITDGQLRLFAYGALLASALLATAAAVSSGGSLPIRRAIILVWIAVGALRFPAGGDLPLVSLGALLAGAALLLGSLSEDRRVSAVGTALAAGAALATPLFPARASFFLFAAAGAVWFLRGGGIVRGVLAVAMSAVAGRWALPIAVVPLASAVLFRVRPTRGEEMMPLPFLRGVEALAPLGRVLAFDPSFLARVFAAGRRTAVSAFALAVISLFVRTPVALLYVLAAALFVAPPRRGPWSRSFALVPAVLLFAMVSLLGWSGVSHGLFPLPLPVSALLAIALVGTCAGLAALRTGWATGAVVAILFALFVATIHPVHSSEAPREQIPLLPGGSATISLPPNNGAIALIASGANIAGLEPGTVVGSVEVLAADGSAYRRDLRVGDMADWAAFRWNQWFFSSNRLPAEAAGRIDGFGISSIMTGSGRVDLGVTKAVAALRVMASPSLAADARLHIDGVEVASR